MHDLVSSVEIVHLCTYFGFWPGRNGVFVHPKKQYPSLEEVVVWIIL